jgi:hypothetical protein
MESGITFLPVPIPGIRLSGNAGDGEDGSMIALRRGGEEILFASWEVDEVEGSDDAKARGMVWVPVGEFSPDPEAIRPPDIGVDDLPAEEQPDGTAEREGSPFGGARSGLKRRPTTGG